jgi:hypothetical protein
VFDVGLDELCSRHGSVTRLLRRDKKLLPERIAVNKFMRAGRRVRVDGTALAEAQSWRCAQHCFEYANSIWMSIHP